MGGYKSFCVTLWKLSGKKHELLWKLEPMCSVMFASLEQCPTTGQYHIQLFFTLKHDVGNKSFKWVQDALGFKKDKKEDDRCEGWVIKGGGKKAANHEYIIRGIGTDGVPKTFSCPFIEKDLHEKEVGILDQLCEALDEGKCLKILMREPKFRETISRNRNFLMDYQRNAMYDREKAKEKWYPPTQFTRTLEWRMDKTMLITGEGRLGKTKWIQAHFPNNLLVRNWDALKMFSGEDCIILDDMDKHIQELKRSEIINLLDRETVCTVHCRYTDFLKPISVPMFIVTNGSGRTLFGDLWDDISIKDRLEEIYVAESLKMPVNP